MNTQSKHPVDLSKTSAEIDTMREPSYILRQALDLLDEATSYTSCETWSPSLTDEINSFVVNTRAMLTADAVRPPQAVQGGEAVERSVLDVRAVYAAMSPQGHARTSSENVADVLDAASLLLASHPAPAPAAVPAGWRKTVEQAETLLRDCAAYGMEPYFNDGSPTPNAILFAGCADKLAAMLSAAPPPPNQQSGGAPAKEEK